MKRIKVGKNGDHALVDDEDYLMLITYAWHLGTDGYAISAKKINGKVKTLRMHREVIKEQLINGLQVDHINGIRLDNRKKNLRPCTVSQNCMNKKTRKDSISGLKGVGYCRHNKKWRARIVHNGKRIHLGHYATAELAHEAYKSASKLYHKEFSRTK